MELWANINGKDYPLSFGTNITDELGETLDSGSITIPHVSEAIEAKPYDDVIIHDWGRGNLPPHTMWSESNPRKQGGHFYWHFLLWNISREQVNIADRPERSGESGRYFSYYFNYSMQLISEAKGLEAVQLPNRTVTQPQRTDEMSNPDSCRTIYDVASEMVDLYSPWIRVTEDGSTWSWRRKYGISQRFRDKFSSSICPEMSFNSPTLREALNRLCMVKDCIVTVKDGLIDYLSISERSGEFSVSPSISSFETWSMDGSSYCDRLLREYSGALSRDSVAKCVERIGFRNSSSDKMTLSNMRLELSNPIYEIESIRMCYYKKTSDGRMFLCRQDITPLVIRDEARRLLSEDWTKYSDLNARDISDVAKFKYATIGYSQGSKYIGGWGEMYSTMEFSPIFGTNFKHRHSVIENIFEFMDGKFPLGIDAKGFLFSESKQSVIDGEGEAFTLTDALPCNPKIVNPNGGSDLSATQFLFDKGIAWITNNTLRLKTMFFEVEYMGFISASVVSSKDWHDGIIVTRDGQSSSLPIIESDGVSEKEKVNRLGNASMTVRARYSRMSDIAALGSVRNDKPLHEDEIAFRRSMRFERDYIDVTYYLCRDYVLRNYFTSVYAKNRVYSLASYGESVERKESKSIQILLSNSKSYYQGSSTQLETRRDAWKEALSFFKETSKIGEYLSEGSEGINISHATIPGSNKDSVEANERAEYSGSFAMDYQAYTAGNSICWSMSMQDSSTMGVYVSRWSPRFGSYIATTLSDYASVFAGYLSGTNTTMEAKDALDVLSGSFQEWYSIPCDIATGKVERMSFSVGKDTSKESYLAGSLGSYSESLAKGMMASAKILPQLDAKITNPDGTYFNTTPAFFSDGDSGSSEWFKGTTKRMEISDFAKTVFMAKDKDGTEREDAVLKDGKERITVTMQMEPVSDTKDIMLSEKMMQLSDLFGKGKKTYSTTKDPIANVFPNIEASVVMAGNIFDQNASFIELYQDRRSFLHFPTANIVASRIDLERGIDFDEPQTITCGSFSLTVTGVHPSIGSDGSIDVRSINVDASYRIGDKWYSKTIKAYNYESYADDYVEAASAIKTSSGAHSLLDIFGSMGDKSWIDNDGGEWASRFVTSMRPKPWGSIDTLTYSIVFDDGWEGALRDETFGTSENNGDVPDRESKWGSESFRCVYTYDLYDVASGAQPVELRANAGTLTISPIEQENLTYKCVSQNMFWVYSPERLSDSDPFETIPSLDGLSEIRELDIRHEGGNDGTPARMSMTNLGPSSFQRPEGITMADAMRFGSIRLYHKETEGAYRFVFGTNGSIWNRLSNPSGSYWYQLSVYASFMDNRSKTVWNASTGYPSHRIMNMADPDERDDKSYGEGNYCLPKEAERN